MTLKMLVLPPHVCCLLIDAGINTSRRPTCEGSLAPALQAVPEFEQLVWPKEAELEAGLALQSNQEGPADWVPGCTAGSGTACRHLSTAACQRRVVAAVGHSGGGWSQPCERQGDGAGLRPPPGPLSVGEPGGAAGSATQQ